MGLLSALSHPTPRLVALTALFAPRLWPILKDQLCDTFEARAFEWDSIVGLFFSKPFDLGNGHSRRDAARRRIQAGAESPALFVSFGPRAKNPYLDCTALDRGCM